MKLGIDAVRHLLALSGTGRRCVECGEVLSGIYDTVNPTGKKGGKRGEEKKGEMV
jgi:hypothetical protein